MKFSITTLFIVFLLQIHAQTDKQNIIKTNFNLSFNTNDLVDVQQNDHGNIISDKTINLKYSVFIGRRFKSNFYYGFGMVNEFLKYEINPDAEPYGISISTSYSSYKENTVVKSNTYGPTLFIKYFTSLSERIHLAFDLLSGYKFYSQTLEIGYGSPDLRPGEPIGGFYSYNYLSVYNNSYNYIPIYEQSNEINDFYLDLKKQFITFSINPSIRFDLVKNFGMDLTFGTIQYKQKTKDSRTEGYDIDKKTQEFHMNFKPQNWLIGFFYKL